MADVAGKPWIKLLVNLLYQEGVNDIVICNNKSQDFYSVLGDSFCEAELDYLDEIERSGTAGAIKRALPYAYDYEHILVVNGDTYAQVNLNLLKKVHKHAGNLLTMTICPAKPGLGNVALNKRSDTLAEYYPEPTALASWLNAGVYLMDKEFIREWPDEISSLEREILPKMIGSTCFRIKEPIVDMGTPEGYDFLNHIFCNEQ